MSEAVFGPRGWVWRMRFGGRRGGRCGPRGSGRPWWAEMVEGPPPRAERGEIRFVVLDAIAEQPRHGYEIIQHVESRTGGSYRPSPGVVYPTLQLLDELGHAEAQEEGGRKSYAITEAGRTELEDNRRAVENFYERFGEESWEAHVDDFGELMQAFGRLVRSFKRAHRRGRLRGKAKREIRAILERALQDVEKVLEGEP